MQHQDNNTPSASLQAMLAKARENAQKKGLYLTDDDIESYARGDLDAETTAILELRMTQDADFAAEVKAEMALADGIREYAKAHPIERADNEETQTVRTKEPAPMTASTNHWQKSVAAETAPMTASTKNWRRWLVAASIALLCGAAVWWLQPKNPETLLAELKAQEMGDFTRLEANRNYANTLDFPSFENLSLEIGQGHYRKVQEAILNNIQISRELENGSEFAYLLGITWLHEDEYDKALKVFQYNIEHKNQVFADFYAKSVYGAALCYFAKKDKVKANEMLDILIKLAPNDDFGYAEKAKYLKNNI